jgi:hypothetical protein
MKNRLSSKERIMRVFRGEETDRPVFKLWGAGATWDRKKLLAEAYAPVCELAARTTDIFAGAGSPFDVFFGQNAARHVSSERVKTASPLWDEIRTTIRTPEGALTGIDRVSNVGSPGYTVEHFIKGPEDVNKLLSVPYEPFPFSADGFIRAEEALGDRGIVMFGLDHAGYSLQRMAGSETFAVLSVDERELVDEAVATLSERIRAHAKAAIDAGLSPVFSWVGPELLIPPLMGYADFEDFCFRYDKPLCDMIHEAGGYVWVHCHGKVVKLLDRFIEMGVDVLNPLEPPKNGDVDIAEIARKYRGKIGLEGNIEIQELLQAEPERLKKLISDCVSAGAQSGRFILCQSAGFMEYPFPEQRYIDNLMLYLEYGLECVEKAGG